MDKVNLHLFFFWFSYLILTSEYAYNLLIPFNTVFNFYLLILYIYWFLYAITKSFWIGWCASKNQLQEKKSHEIKRKFYNTWLEILISDQSNQWDPKLCTVLQKFYDRVRHFSLLKRGRLKQFHSTECYITEMLMNLDSE